MEVAAVDLEVAAVEAVEAVEAAVTVIRAVAVAVAVTTQYQPQTLLLPTI